MTSSEKSATSAGAPKMKPEELTDQMTGKTDLTKALEKIDAMLFVNQVLFRLRRIAKPFFSSDG